MPVTKASSYNVTPSGATRTTVLDPTMQSMSSEAAAAIGSITTSQPIQGGGQPALPGSIEGSNPPTSNGGVNFGGVITERTGRLAGGGLLQPYPLNMLYGNRRLIGPVLVSERTGRLAGGELYGPPPTLTTHGNVAMANIGNAGQPPANAATIRNILAGGPVTTGNVVALARPLGNEMMTEIGGPNTITREATTGQVATVGGIATEQNVQNPLLTEYLNAVYTPVITRTIGSPTNIVVRRTVGNVGTATLGNVQGGLTISGQQGSVYIPAQQLLAATAT